MCNEAQKCKQRFPNIDAVDPESVMNDTHFALANPSRTYIYFLYLGDPPGGEVQCPEVLTTEKGKQQKWGSPRRGSTP